jgi:hypothetical protein
MTEPFILQYVPQRIEQLGYTNYHLRYREIIVSAGQNKVIPAYNELYFIIDDPPGIFVESDYGTYNTIDTSSAENMHQHRGEIVITNPGVEDRRVKFIQVIIVN